MFYKKNQMKKIITFSIALIMIFSLLPINNSNVFAIGVDLAQIAVSNNYAEYQDGTEVKDSLGNITAYDVYVLEKEGADTSQWERNNTNLKEETLELIDNNRTDAGIKALAQYYLVTKEYEDLTRTAMLINTLQDQQNTTTGIFGYSDIYSNMPLYDMLGKVGDLSELDIEACKTYVMEEQNVEDPSNTEVYGAWGIAQWYQDTDGSWKQGAWGPDFISSVQGVRVLSYLYDITSDSDINNRKNIGLEWLMAQQQEDGSFMFADWDDPTTNTAEMIITLDQLGERGSTAWDKAVNYLESNALNENRQFGRYGGIGNNTLVLEAYRVINAASLSNGTVIGINIISDETPVSVGLSKQFNTEAYKFGVGKEIFNHENVIWSTSDSDIAVASEGLLKIFADEEVILKVQYNELEDEKTISTKSNPSIIAVSNNYAEYQDGLEVKDSLGNITAYDVYVLEKEGADTSQWERNNTNLKEETLELIDNNRTDAGIKALAQYYLVTKEYEDLTRTAMLINTLQDQQNTTTGIFGYSDIYSNMPLYDMLGKVGDLSELDIEACKTYVMEEQNVEDPSNTEVYGAWGIAQWYQDTDGSWKQGAWGPDFISSVQGVRVLSYLYDITSDSDINNRKNIGLEWLMAQQQEDGSFMFADWDDPTTNTAEMIITLDQLGERGSTAWDKAVNYLESNALNENRQFGRYGGVGNNTLMLEANNTINEEPLVAGTVIEMEIPSSVEISVGDYHQFNPEVYRFGLGFNTIAADLVHWSIASNGNVASINSSGRVTAQANGTAIVTSRFGNFEKLVNITVEGGEIPGNAEEQQSYVRITMYVSGIDDEVMYADVLKLTDDEGEGITVLDALDATNLNYRSRGAYVYKIDGLSEKETSALSGWKYKVNNMVGDASADNYYLDNKDVVIWFYADGPLDEGPSLSSLISNLEKVQEEEEESVDINKSKEDNEKMLSDAIKKDGQAVLDLENNPNSKVYLSPKTLNALGENDLPLTIKNDAIKIEFSPDSIPNHVLTQAKEHQSASVEIKAAMMSEEEKEELLRKADPEALRNLLDVGGQIIDLSAYIVYSDDEGVIQRRDKIETFFEPVKVTIAITEDMSVEEAKRITGIRYEVDEDGNTIPVKLGGIYDPESQTITFYTNRFSYYGVRQAKELQKIILQIDEPQITINDEVQDIDVAPVIMNSRTMVPLRFVSEALGAEVQWIGEERKVIIIHDGQTIELVIGEISDPSLDVPPAIMNNRTMVPIRYISEKLEANVLWIPSIRTVEIVR